MDGLALRSFGIAFAFTGRCAGTASLGARLSVVGDNCVCPEKGHRGFAVHRFGVPITAEAVTAAKPKGQEAEPQETTPKE